MAEVVVMHMMYDGPYKQLQLVRYPAKPSDVLLRVGKVSPQNQGTYAIYDALISRHARNTREDHCGADRGRCPKFEVHQRRISTFQNSSE